MFVVLDGIFDILILMIMIKRTSIWASGAVEMAQLDVTAHVKLDYIS